MILGWGSAAKFQPVKVLPGFLTSAGSEKNEWLAKFLSVPTYNIHVDQDVPFDLLGSMIITVYYLLIIDIIVDRYLYTKNTYNDE